MRIDTAHFTFQRLNPHNASTFQSIHPAPSNFAAAKNKPLVALACGGTGGHLFPGVAVAEELTRRGCEVLLLVSQKEVDQRGVTSALGMRAVALPAVGMTQGRRVEFLSGFWKSYRAARELFRERVPHAVLAMGGFTSAPPVLAGKRCGAATFLHESNTIPGRANRLLAHVVDQCFVGFPEAVGRLHHTRVTVTGTPVRPQFQPADAASCRIALGLDPKRPVLLLMGGSQGASGINQLVLQALPKLLQAAPELQFLHLTGANDFEKAQAAYRAHVARVVVQPFLTEMELALGAATIAMTRAGASSLAELAAMQVPSILVPYPAAVDNHQLVNAQAFQASGAARLLQQKGATAEQLAAMILELMLDAATLTSMREALGRWHSPHAAEEIADKMMLWMQARGADCLVKSANG